MENNINGNWIIFLNIIYLKKNYTTLFGLMIKSTIYDIQNLIEQYNIYSTLFICKHMWVKWECQRNNLSRGRMMTILFLNLARVSCY